LSVTFSIKIIRGEGVEFSVRNKWNNKLRSNLLSLRPLEIKA